MEFKSVNKLLEKSFAENWDLPALSNYQGARLSYATVAERVEHIHICYRECGLEKGDKVALCARNQTNWAISFIATLTYGAVPVPILHEFKPGNIHYLVNHSESKVLFVDESIWEGLSESEMPGLSAVVQMNTLKFIWSSDPALIQVRANLSRMFRERHPDGFRPEDMNYYEDSPEELALLNYTSGTSGFSKGVMIPYRALYTNMKFAGWAEPHIGAGSDIVAMLPSAHMYGLMFEFLFQMTIGSHVHFLTRVPSPKVITTACEEVKPDLIISVPLVLEKLYKTRLKDELDRNRILLKLPVLDKVVLQRMRSALMNAFGGKFEEVIIGGAALNPEVERLLRRLGFPFTVGYGMTECAPIITYDKWNANKPCSCGKAIPSCEIRIDSPDPQNVPGEVQVRGDNLFLGYYRNEDATERAFTGDGWFRTGDMGVMDKDGYLYLKGRLKCMILGPSGQNIYPEELESVINNIDYVVDCLVVSRNGEIVALVYPDYHRAGLGGMNGRQVDEFITEAVNRANEEFPNYAHIKRVEFMPEDFERTPKRNIKRYLYQK